MGPDTSRRLFPLTSCNIGLWGPVEGMRPFLLLCPDRKQFVVLLARDQDTKAHDSSAGSLSVNAVLACARNTAALWLRHKNPFIDHTQEPSLDTAVLTFEVAFSDVVGMDFRWPLTDTPRLVLESSCLCKRVFDSVDEVCAHYPPVRQRRLRALAAASASSAAAAAAAAGETHLQQLVHSKQQQQQQHGSDAASTVGLMSRVSSWASWTIGSARTSIDVFAAAAHAPAPAPATPAAAEQCAGDGNSAPAGVGTFASAAGGNAGDAATEGPQQSAGGFVLSALAQEQQQAQQQAQAGGATSASGQRSDSGNSGSSRGPGCTLDSMISLNVGIAGTAAQAAAAAAVDATEAAEADDCCSKPQQQHQPEQVAYIGTQAVATRRTVKHNRDPGSSSSRGGNTSTALLAATAAAGDSTTPVLLNSRLNTPGISPVPSGCCTPLGEGALSDSGLSEHAALLQGALAEASFGFWQQPGQHEALPGELGERRLQVQTGARHSARHGAATAPCSMPNSPRLGDSLTQSSPMAASEAGVGSLSRFDQHLPQQQQQQHRSRTALRTSAGGSRRSSRSRLAAAAAAAESSCPLCRQTLVQPHAVVQQRYHQQLEHKHVRLAAAAGQHVGGSKCAKSGAVARSRSACSLQQLQQAQHQERAGSDGGSGGAVPALDLQRQQQAGSDEQEGHKPLSPRSFAGLAAAAIGVLAARCRPSSGSIGMQGEKLLRLQRADTGASDVCMPDSVTAAAAAAAATSASSGDDVDAQRALEPQPLQQQQQREVQDVACPAGSKADFGAVSSSRLQSAAAAGACSSSHAGTVAPAGAFEASAPGLAEIAAALDSASSGALASGVDAAARVSVGDKAPAAAGATAGVGAASGAAPGAAPDTAPAAAPVNNGSLGGRQTMYSNRTVVLTFSDPTLPYQLSKLVKNPSNVHLLKLYESGLPAWAVVLPSYGLWYRPWLRRVTWLLFVLLSVVSMAMGFYDLWKNVPYFKQFVVSMFRPAAAVFEWLEAHTQIRLSILLTYMVGKSQIFVQLGKLLMDASLQPLLAPFAPLASFATAIGEGIAWMLQPFVEVFSLVFGPIGRLAWVLLQLLWRLVSTLLWFGPLQLVQLVGSLVMGLVQLLLLPFETVLPAAASFRAGWSAAKATGQVARNAAPVVAEAARTAASAGPWWWWSPFEALELMRVSTVRVVKALQAVLRFLVTLASTINKHRLSLMMQLKGKLWGGLQAAAASPAGRVATVVAHRMGQGDRLRRVQHSVARKLHAQDSLNSMGSEALGSIGPFSPAAADGYPYRPYSRTYSLDGESEILLETPEQDTEDDDASTEVSSSMRWLQQQQQQQHDEAAVSTAGASIPQAPARPLRTSAGLRQRAVTAAAAAAAAAAAGEGAGVGAVQSAFLLPRPGPLQQQQQQVLGGDAGLGAHAAYAGTSAGNGLAASSLYQQYMTGLLAGSGPADLALTRSSSNSSIQDPAVFAAAAAAAALSRGYDLLPDSGFHSSAAAAAATVSAADLQQLRLRQSCDAFGSGFKTDSSFSTAVGLSTMTAAAGGESGLATGPVGWRGASAGALGATGVHSGSGQQRGAQLQAAGSPGLSCSGAALLTEAAGLLMLPERHL